jgi:hypothetical protein
MMREVRRALTPYILWRALEVALGVAALVVVMSVLADHARAPRYLITVGGLAGFTAAMTAQTAALLVRGARLDRGGHAGPVTVLQRDLEQLKRAEYRAFTWALGGGVLLWLPAALVLFEAVTGVDAIARVDLAWLLGNLGFGAVALGLGQVLSRRYVERDALSPRARRIVDAVSGRALRVATAHLAELAKFERDEPPAA